MVTNVIHHANAMSVLRDLADVSVDLVYIDPPFGTGITQNSHDMSYEDSSMNYMDFLRPHIIAVHRVLKSSGTMYLHLDWRYVHQARLYFDGFFGKENFLNEVIWSYNYGGRGKDRWPRKHDNILVYAKNAGQHVFDWDAIPRIPYKAPEMQRVGRTQEEAEERIARGQVPTDVWEMSIVGTNSKERTGYPTQKPLKLLERIVLASSPPAGTVLDVFAGSGTTGAAAHKHGRQFILADVNPQAIEVMKARFKDVAIDWRM
jgi:site-specific DNA-methyltransferase (adenine-specific)